MMYQIVLLVSLGSLLLHGKCMGQGERMVFDEYKEAIQNYIMTGHENEWKQCEILSDGFSLMEVREMGENIPYATMELNEMVIMDVKSYFALSNCLLVIGCSH